MAAPSLRLLAFGRISRRVRLAVVRVDDGWMATVLDDGLGVYPTADLARSQIEAERRFLDRYYGQAAA